MVHKKLVNHGNETSVHLPRSNINFEPFLTLLGKDFYLENNKYPHIKVLLKTQKKRDGKNEVVEVFGTSNFFCPIQAIYYKSTSKLPFAVHKPTFITEDG